MRQVLAKFLKTFLMLYGGKSLLGMLIARRFDLKRLANHDSANFAMAIAGMRATYYGLIISPDWRRILGEYHVSLSAAFASLWLLIDRSPQRRVYIALTLSIKAALFYTRSLIYQAPESPEFEGQTELRAYQLIHRKSPWLNASSQLIHRHGTLLVWYIVAFHVTLTSYNYPHLLPKSYYNSLVELTGLKGKYGRDLPAVTEALQYFTDLSSKGLHPEVFKVPDGITSVNFLKSLSQNNEEWSVRAQNAFIPISSRMSPSAHHSRLMCMLQHPENTSCLTAAAQGGVDVFSFAFKNYAVINGVCYFFNLGYFYVWCCPSIFQQAQAAQGSHYCTFCGEITRIFG